MAKHQQIHLDEIVGYFDELEDPRSAINQKHPWVSVVVIAMMAVLAGAGGPTAIAKWAKLKAEFLLKFLDLPHGVPRKDVFRRVLCLLKPDTFQRCFVSWLQSLRDQAAEASGVDQPIFAIDGKSSRRSHDHKKGLGALHSVTVWASEFGLSLGQVACAEKSNEITAIPELLRLVVIQGCFIKINAMGTQKGIRDKIVNERKPRDVAAGRHRPHRRTEQKRLCGRASSSAHHQRNRTWPRGDPQLHSNARAGDFARLGIVERIEVDRYGNLGVRSRRQRNHGDTLLHQQSAGECQAIRPRDPQPLGYRKQLSLDSGHDLP